MAGENTQLNINRARVDRFQLLLSDMPSSQLLFPDGSSDTDNRMAQLNDREYFGLSLQTVDLPGLTLEGEKIGTRFVDIAERTMKLTYDSFTTEIRMDKKFRIYNLFALWIMMIKNPEGYNQFAMKETYDRCVVQGVLLIKDPMTEENLMQIDIFDLFPQTLPTINFNYTSEEEIALPITWHYSYWMPRTATGQPIPIKVNPHFSPRA